VGGQGDERVRIWGLESGGLAKSDPAPDDPGDHPIEGQHVVVRGYLVGQGRRHLRHASGVAGRAYPATFAGEGQEPIMPAVRAACPRQNAAMRHPRFGTPLAQE